MEEERHGPASLTSGERTEYQEMLEEGKTKSKIIDIRSRKPIPKSTFDLLSAEIDNLELQARALEATEQFSEVIVRTLELAFDALNDMVCILDVNCQVQFANAALTRATRRSRSSLQGMPYVELLSVLRGGTPLSTEALSGSCTLLHEEMIERVLSSALNADFACSFSPLYDDNGTKLIGYVNLIRDVKPLRHAQAENDLVARTRSTMVTNMVSVEACFRARRSIG